MEITCNTKDEARDVLKKIVENYKPISKNYSAYDHRLYTIILDFKDNKKDAGHLFDKAEFALDRKFLENIAKPNALSFVTIDARTCRHVNSLFGGMDTLQDPPQIIYLNDAINTAYMFEGCKQLKTVNLDIGSKIMDRVKKGKFYPNNMFADTGILEQKYGLNGEKFGFKAKYY